MISSAAGASARCLHTILHSILTAITYARSVPLCAAQHVTVDPHLPEWLPELTLSNLRVGDSVATLRFFRKSDGGSDYECWTNGDRSTPCASQRHGRSPPRSPNGSRM